MKKLMKKAGAFLLSMAMMISCMTFTSYAAEGVVQFSDPSGAAGETVEMRVKVICEAGGIGDYTIDLTYDPSLLRFESGDNATGGNGTITLTSAASGNDVETLHTLKFTALDEGTSTVDVSNYNASLSSGEELNLSLGNGTVTAEGGTPVTEEEKKSETASTTAVSGLTVDVDGISYTINTEFKEKDVPLGCTAEDTQYNGNPVKAMKIDATGQFVYFLTNGEGVSDYYIFNDKEGTFSKTEPVLINNTMTLFIVDSPADKKLPAKFQETTMSIGDKEFAIWNNMDNQDYYLVYAISSEGTDGFYQYDSVEHTYQRANMADFEVAKDKKTEAPAAGIMKTIQDNLMYVLIGAAALILILLIIIIILSVKVSKKNKKDFDDSDMEFDFAPKQMEEKPKKEKKSKKKKAKDYDDDYDLEFDDYDDLDDDFSDNEDFDIDFEDYDDKDFFSDDADDDFDDFEEELEEPVKKPEKKQRRRKKKDDDDFSVDFIEL